MVRKHLTGNQHHIKDPLEGSRFSCYFKSQNLCVVQCTYVESKHTDDDVRVNSTLLSKLFVLGEVAKKV